MRSKRDAGKTLEQVKAEGMPEKYKDWGSAFVKQEQWLTTVYQSLSGKKPDAVTK